MDTIVLGFDPGAARVGWAALGADAHGARHLGSGVLPVDLAGDSGLEALRAAAGALLSRYRPALVAVERVVRVFPRPRFGPAMASELCGASWVGAELAGLAAARGLVVRTATLQAVRSALGCARAGDGALAAALRARVAGWPVRSSEHARDAAAVAWSTTVEMAHAPAAQSWAIPAGLDSDLP
ncbi:crossover junction endodeoxyribonuclease ruvC [Sorangium cellulosum]|uniref:Crossover junction endodeoxyribonuclease ruvC n=1 Tax=Sorangium cellulosum TaxID=56 RepID=A0A4P2Q6R0_SORCE|nr:crossover junction endodeoxyribonuclease RuvC [Sorangium cellulosum]AUX25120.1 crossover junction endodeoxyribonuclease ruvC [Sorangium cellulosum]